MTFYNAYQVINDKLFHKLSSCFVIEIDTVAAVTVAHRLFLSVDKWTLTGANSAKQKQSQTMKHLLKGEGGANRTHVTARKFYFPEDDVINIPTLWRNIV